LRRFGVKFHHDHDVAFIPDFARQTNATLEDIVITPASVRKALSNLDPSKQGGVDGISNRMLKRIATSIDLPLCRLFNLFLSHGHFPSNWKLGVVVPIFKNKGNKSSTDNYRPVTLLNCVSKVFERLVYDVMLQYFLRNDLLYEFQSGFIPGHDTQKQLLSIVHMIQCNSENRMVTRGVLLDIAGAFDVVPHFLLLKKLECYGIKGAVFNLICKSVGLR
jgi:sarcosine oxidase/L-pipecolate oxidase